jgi:SpoVK/Ycf46/Vps4 family AAA+-type ATPase
MDLFTELEGLFKANVPLINLVTYEEERVIKTIERIKSEMGIYTWDVADGFHTVREARQSLSKKEVTSDKLLPFLEKEAPENSIFILKDFHLPWKGQHKSYITRKLRNMVPSLRAKNRFLIFTTPILDLPVELKDDVMVVHVPLPDGSELDNLFNEVTRSLDRTKLPKSEVRQKLISSALGLTTNQARLAFSRVWASQGCFDERGIEMITWAKRDVIRESGALEFWPAEEGEANVGGLDLLKFWLKKREKAFSEEARAAGLPFPRGVSLIGIPGTGKSLTAKMLSGLWKLPLLRLDVGALFASLLGESEQNMRLAIQLAETVSPCILWIDEMEKAFAGTSGGLNGGAATRVFGSFLTWMQEHKSPVFVIATANDVRSLPPELIGRFDRTFFLDLPNAIERREIFRIHLKRAGVMFPERTFNLDQLVDRSSGFVGREIERAVREAQFTAFDDENREMEQQDVMAALSETIPIERSHPDEINELKKWKTEGRAMPASSEEPKGGQPIRRVIETEQKP